MKVTCFVMTARFIGVKFLYKHNYICGLSGTLISPHTWHNLCHAVTSPDEFMPGYPSVKLYTIQQGSQMHVDIFSVINHNNH